MDAEQARGELSSLYRDNRLSVLVGPLKMVLPILSAIFLFPIMLSKSGIEVVGLWSVLSTTVAFIYISDMGFSQLLVRDAGEDMEPFIDAVYKDYVTAQIIYLLLFIFCTILFYIVSDSVLSPLEGVYSVSALKLAIPAMIAGTFLQLAAKLDASILTARHDNYFVQIFSSVIPACTYVSMILGALMSKPIEGLAVGAVITGLVSLFTFRARTKAKYHIFDTLVLNSRYAPFRNIVPLCQRGWHLFSSSLGQMVRAPIYRYLIASTIGLPAVAVFDIAMRITQSARDIIAMGFGVLYPSFSILVRRNRMDLVVEMIRVSLMLLLSFGALSLGSLVALIDPILTLWLGTPYPENLKSSIIILSLWQVITLFNVPFWHLLLSSGNERVAARSIWLHTFLLLLIVPASHVFTLSISDILLYWSITSVATQMLIFSSVESKLGIFWLSIRQRNILSVMVLAFSFLACCYWLSTNIGGHYQLVTILMVTAAIFSVISAKICWSPLRIYLRKERI